jgi:hypothetical protein
MTSPPMQQGLRDQRLERKRVRFSQLQAQVAWDLVPGMFRKRFLHERRAGIGQQVEVVWVLEPELPQLPQLPQQRVLQQQHDRRLSYREGRMRM